MDKVPIRKNIRLKHYDYSQAGYYFVTICTNKRMRILSNIVGGGFHAAPIVQLNKIGEEIINTINFVENQYPNIFLDKYVIMPNHIQIGRAHV